MKKFLVAICAATLLFSGCGNDKTAEQSKPTPKVEQTTQTPADEAKVKETIQATTQAPPPAPAKVLNLGMTFEQFKAAYNAKIREIAQDVDWDISSVDLIYGQYDDTFEYEFASEGILIGTVEKDTGFVKEICVMSSPKSQLESAKMFFAYTVTILILSPELNVEQRKALLTNLKLIADKIPELELSKGMAVCGNVRYTTRLIDGVFLLTATAKDL